MKPSLDFDEQLKSIPLRNENVQIERDAKDPDILTAQVSLSYKGLLKAAKRMFKLRSHRCFELFGMSRELYEKLDGKLTVEDLVLWLAESEKLTFFEARAFMLQYLSGLMQRGLIVVIPGEE